MADIDKKKILSDLDDDLSKLESSLNNVAGIISDKILNKLSDIKDDTRNWVEAFGKGEDVTKKVNAKLSELQKQSNKLALNRVKLESDLSRAQQQGNAIAERKIRTALLANRYADQEVDKTQTLLVKLKQVSEEEARIAEIKRKQNGTQGAIENLKKQFRIDEIKDLFTIAGIIKLIVNAALRFNETSVNISKNLGYGADNADRVAQNLTQVANNSTNINVTLKNAAEAMNELNTATGGVAEYSADALETQIMLTKQLGLSGEEAAGIYKFSVLTGKASSQVNDEMAAAFANTRNLVKGSANFKTTMAEVAKVSGQLAINFKNNPAALTAAIVQAQKLGTTLEQTKNQGEALLNFESSIENELKAELLTGQQMNLERARAAALMGDQATVMKELANQGMTLEKFQNMNVIAQKSFAEALGLSADQLSEQLRKQKVAQEQGKSLAEITADEAKEAERRQTIQDKFNAAIEKLQDFLGNLVAGPFGTMLDILSQALDMVNLILAPFQMIYNFTSMIGQAIFGWVDKLGVVGKILKGLAGIAIIWAAYSAFQGLANNPILALIPGAGVAAGIAAAAAITAAGFGLLNNQKAGDMISPADGKTQISTKEGGLFELSKNDDVLAGPGLAKAAKGGKGESISPNIDLTPMIAAINEVKASVDKLYSKDTTINMDGKRVGTTLTQGSYKVA
jgi:hypothetical protein